MKEYTTLGILEYQPWLVGAVAVIVAIILLLPSRVVVKRGRRRSVEYVSPLVRYLSEPTGWVIELSGVARAQRALLEIISWMWARGKGTVQAHLWAIVRGWMSRW